MHPTEILLGYPYFKAKRYLEKSEYYSKAQHIQHQRKALSNLLEFAAKKIPYYKDKVGELSGDISENSAIEVLKQFPLSSKSVVRENIGTLSKSNYLRRYKDATGGTTASPMFFYRDRLVTRQAEKAFMWNQWSRVGYQPCDQTASFTGRAPKKDKLFDHDRLFNKYVFSSFDLNPEKIGVVVSALNNICPLFLHGYPSTLSSLAKLVQQKSLRLSFEPKAVFCGSEKTLPHQRELLEDVFGTTVYSWYGHSEYAVLGGECEHSTSYHLFPQYGYVEFLEIENAVHESGEKLYEIVATGFNNKVMPFIRYRTADYAILDESTCTCGRQYPLIREVVGKAQEFVVDNKENLVSVIALSYLFETMPFIDEVMIVQDTPGILNYLIQPSCEPTKSELDGLKSKIATATRGRLKAKVELVDEIPKTTSLKRRIVDQRIDLNSYLNN